jgi:hypothetical protein
MRASRYERGLRSRVVLLQPAVGSALAIPGMLPLDVLALHHFAPEDGVDGLMGGADDAFVTGAAGLILLNPDHQKLFFNLPPAVESIPRLQNGLRTSSLCIKAERIKVKNPHWLNGRRKIMSQEPYYELLDLGVGKQYAELLKTTGVDSVPELAERHPESLHLHLVVTNAEKKLVRKLPTPSQVAMWVQQAQKLWRPMNCG